MRGIPYQMENINWLNARFEDLPANAISKKKKNLKNWQIREDFFS